MLTSSDSSRLSKDVKPTSNRSAEAPAWLRKLREADLFFLSSISFLCAVALDGICVSVAPSSGGFGELQNRCLKYWPCFPVSTQWQWCCSWLASLLPWIIQPMRTKQQVTKWPVKRLYYYNSFTSGHQMKVTRKKWHLLTFKNYKATFQGRQLCLIKKCF